MKTAASIISHLRSSAFICGLFLAPAIFAASTGLDAIGDEKLL
ncbi:MAG: hypothetical protein JWM57_3370, partial [Phycisphaerales bacterium]|nr:hypothetical protein [Phycisphaerales bacterium]